MTGDDFIAFSCRPTCMQTMDRLRYVVGQNRCLCQLPSGLRVGHFPRCNNYPPFVRNFSGAVCTVFDSCAR